MSVAVPDETSLVEVPGSDELGPLQHSQRARSWDRSDVAGQLECWYPSGVFDVEAGGRKGVESEKERGRIERVVAGEGKPPPQLAPPGRHPAGEAESVGLEADIYLLQEGHPV